MRKEIVAAVVSRARKHCEYCRLPSAASVPLFQIEHIVARVHGGTSDESNLAWACIRCNRYKGTNLAGIDPATNQMVRLFHPREDRWERHFGIIGLDIEGVTEIGRASVNVLRMNDDERRRLRRDATAMGLWPPRLS